MKILIVLVALLCGCVKQNRTRPEEKWVEVVCVECNGAGVIEENEEMEWSMARCQIYFHHHALKCDVCRRGKGQQLCGEASRKVNSIIEEARDRPQNLTIRECPMCLGDKKLLKSVNQPSGVSVTRRLPDR